MGQIEKKTHIIILIRRYFLFNVIKGHTYLFDLFEARAEILNPISTRLCHVVIYCCGDKSYPCLVGIGLKKIRSLFGRFEAKKNSFLDFN